MPEVQLDESVLKDLDSQKHQSDFDTLEEILFQCLPEHTLIFNGQFHKERYHA